jgi:hypothetical protein
MPLSFASRPRFAGRLVLLEDDTRLVKAPGVIGMLSGFEQSFSSTETTFGASERIVDLSGSQDVRLQVYARAYRPGLFGYQTPVSVTFNVDFQPVGGGAWTNLVNGPTVDPGTNTLTRAITGWVSVTEAARTDVRLRVRVTGPSGNTVVLGDYVELHTRHEPTLLAGPVSGISSSGLRVIHTQVDFGSPGGGESGIATATVPAGWVSVDASLTASLAAISTPDHTPFDAAVEGIGVYVTAIRPGINFDITAVAPGGTWGRYAITVIG